MNFDTPFSAISGTIDNFVAQDIVEGRTVLVNSGAINLNDRFLDNGRFAGGVTGGLNVTVLDSTEVETTNLTTAGNFIGAFGTDASPGDTMVGEISGTLNDGEGGNDTLEGIFSVIQTP